MIRKKKIALIESMNSEWNDLSKEWYSDSLTLPQEDKEEGMGS